VRASRLHKGPRDHVCATPPRRQPTSRGGFLSRGLVDAAGNLECCAAAPTGCLTGLPRSGQLEAVGRYSACASRWTAVEFESSIRSSRAIQNARSGRVRRIYACVGALNGSAALRDRLLDVSGVPTMAGQLSVSDSEPRFTSMIAGDRCRISRKSRWPPPAGDAVCPVPRTRHRLAGEVADVPAGALAAEPVGSMAG